MKNILTVAAGGALGALVRYALAGWHIRRFPAGTLTVNLVGCALIGCVMGLCHDRAWISENVRLFLVAGFLGALTTFSTFAWQTVALSQTEHPAVAIGNVVVHLVAGLLAVVGGLRGGMWLAAWLAARH